MSETSPMAEMPQNTYLGKVKKPRLYQRTYKSVTNAIKMIRVLKTPPNPNRVKYDNFDNLVIILL